MADRILVIIDMQKDFVTGPLGSEEAVKASKRISKKIEDLNASDENVWYYLTLDTHDNKYLETMEGKNLPVPHCIQGTDGWGLDENINKAISEVPLASTYVKQKNTFGSYALADAIKLQLMFDWHGMLPDIEVVGVCTDICVISNALILKAYFPEARIIVDASCCAGTTPEMHKKALDVMKSCQIEVIGE